MARRHGRPVRRALCPLLVLLAFLSGLLLLPGQALASDRSYQITQVDIDATVDADGTLHWALPDRRKSYYDEDYLPRKLDRVDEAGNLYFDGSPFPWKLADDFDEDKRWGYPKWKVLLGKLTGKGRKCD